MKWTRWFALILMSVLAAPGLALAQARSEPTTIVLRPAAEPRPALKYRLVPERPTLVPGNAAIFYHRAVLMTTEKRSAFAAMQKAEPTLPPQPTEDDVYRWITGPLAEIPRDKAKAYLALFETILKEVELGSKRQTCDWGFDGRSETYTLLLPEIQQMRSVARLQILSARMAVLEGQFDLALKRIEVGLAMGRHVSDGPIVIQALVGLAIENQVNRCIEDVIQAPGSPNLYWAFADRPRPMIDMRPGFDGERHFLEREIPGLLELDRGIWGLDQARKFAAEIQVKLLDLIQGESFPGTGLYVPSGMPSPLKQIGVAALCAKIYPEARLALIAQGRAEVDVDAMPIIQVAILYTFQEFQQIRDESYKWLNLPYSATYAQVTTIKVGMDNPLLAIFYSLTPALNSARAASVRYERILDALQCIEAIRLHAAAHGGKLPSSLDAITEVPLPLDLATGKPFEYKLEGDTASFSGPNLPGAPNHPAYTIRFLLKLAH